MDECQLNKHTCGQRDICVNTRGDFKCVKVDCPAGYKQIGDARK